MPQSPTPLLPLSTLSRIGRTSDLSTREKLNLLADLRRAATRTATARETLGFDVHDVDGEIERLHRRIWRGIGPRIEQQGAKR